MEATAFAPMQEGHTRGPKCARCGRTVGDAADMRYTMCLPCAAREVKQHRPVEEAELRDLIETAKDMIAEGEAAMRKTGRPVPWFSHSARVARLGNQLADVDFSPGGEVFRSACLTVYVRSRIEAEETRAVILAGCQQYAESGVPFVFRWARELREIVQ